MINTDLSRRQEWRAVKGFDNQFTLTFLQSGVAFDTSGYVFAVNIRKIGDSTNVVELAEGDGITNGGASGIVTILLDDTASDIVAKGYFYEIIYVNGSFTNRLLQGTLNLVDDYNTDNTSTSLTLNVDLNGTAVSLNVSMGGGSSTLVGIGTTLETSSADIPLNADNFYFYDFVDAILKKVSWSNIKATLKTYFDTIYEQAIGYTTENQANKENTTLDTSTTKYPTNRLVKETTDSLQSQINGISAVRSVLHFSGVASVVTGVTGFQIIKSFLITANTLQAGDMVEFDFRFSRPASAQTSTTGTRVQVNTTAVTAGATGLTGAINMNNTSKYSLILRSMPITASNKIKGVSVSSTNVTDLVATTTNYDEITVDWTVNQYILVIVDPATSGDSITCEFARIERLRP